MTENTKKDLYYLAITREMIESNLGWGPSSEWTSQDFDLLSDQILEKTGERLSPTTLKRIWGRVRYDNVPHVNTLNVLACFLEYERWQILKQELKNQYELGKKSPLHPISIFPLEETNAKKKKQILWSGFALIAIVLSFIGVLRITGTPELIPEELCDLTPFSTQVVAAGLPNTVVFKYNVSDLPKGEYSIQQSWDPRRRIPIEQEKFELTATYHYPSYYRAKLVRNDQVLKEHDLYIRSGGWMGTIDMKEGPRYLLPEELMQEGQLSTSQKLIDDLGLSTMTDPPSMSFFYVDDMGDLQSDHFTMETAIQNTFRSGNAICQLSLVRVICTKGVFTMRFSIPGCVGDLWELFGDNLLRGKEQDLSAFGCDFEEWQRLRLEVKDRTVKVYRNERLILETEYKEDAGRIAGVAYSFMGSGQVDYLHLKDGAQQAIFSTDFTE